MGGQVRVLQVVKGLGPGGAERLLVSLAAATDGAAVRHEVAYLLPTKQHLVPELDRLGVATHLLAGRRGLTDPRWPGRLRGLAADFDVVHLHSPAVAAIARLAVGLRKRHPVLVSTEHNVWASHKWPTRLANAITAPLDRHRWAVSADVVASMWLPWRDRTEVLVHGVPLEALTARRGDRAAARAAHGWAEDDVVVVSVANLRRNKDHPTLFRAAALALAVEPRLRFLAIGQGPLEAELRAQLEDLQLGDRFVLHGYHHDPPSVLAGADVFTLTSTHEGLPISLVEAMALGLPAVVTQVGGIPEVLTDGVEGLLVPGGAPEALASAYVRLAHDAEERRALGLAAAARARDFDIRRAAETLAARYRRIVGQRP